MDRRGFLKSAGSVGLSYAGAGLFSPLATATRLQAEECSTGGPVNPNWAQKNFEPQAKASSYFIDPPWGYQPANAFDPDEHIGWERNEQLSGAWLEVSFPAPHAVSELWILGQPFRRDVAGSDPYLDTYSRAAFYAPPRRVRCTLADGATVTAELMVELEPLGYLIGFKYIPQFEHQTSYEEIAPFTTGPGCEIELAW